MAPAVQLYVYDLVYSTFTLALMHFCLLSPAVVHGHSLNRFIHHVVGYGGPTIMLIKDSEGRLFGAYMSQGTFHLHLHSGRCTDFYYV